MFGARRRADRQAWRPFPLLLGTLATLVAASACAGNSVGGGSVRSSDLSTASCPVTEEVAYRYCSEEMNEQEAYRLGHQVLVHGLRCYNLLRSGRQDCRIAGELLYRVVREEPACSSLASDTACTLLAQSLFGSQRHRYVDVSAEDEVMMGLPPLRAALQNHCICDVAEDGSPTVRHVIPGSGGRMSGGRWQPGQPHPSRAQGGR